VTEDPEQDNNQDGRRNALLGLGIVLLLVLAGWLLIHMLGNTSRVQDCVMSGRTNCAPIEGAGSAR
jgi:hypothetical protein